MRLSAAVQPWLSSCLGLSISALMASLWFCYPPGQLMRNETTELGWRLRKLGEFKALHETTAKFPGGNLRVTIALPQTRPSHSIP